MLAQDKGKAIVLENTETYEKKMLKLLDPPDMTDDAKTYVKLSKDPTEVIKSKITQKLKSFKDKGNITYKQYIDIKPHSETVPRMYALPKVHNYPTDPPYRPIMDYTGTLLYLQHC